MMSWDFVQNILLKALLIAKSQKRYKTGTYYYSLQIERQEVVCDTERYHLQLPRVTLNTESTHDLASYGLHGISGPRHVPTVPIL